MKKILIQILKYFSFFILFILILLVSASLLLTNRITPLARNYLNSNISTHADFSDARVSFLRRFPNVTIVLDNLLLHSSPRLNSGEFSINTDTLVYARSVFIQFKITDVISGKYKIGSISARNGKINILYDSSGVSNFDIIKSVKGVAESSPVDIKNIDLHNLEVSYCDNSSALKLSGIVKSGKLRSTFKDNNIELSAAIETSLRYFQLKSKSYKGEVNGTIAINLSKAGDIVTVRKGALSLDALSLGVDGIIEKRGKYDLKLSGKSIHLDKLMTAFNKFFPGNLASWKTYGDMTLTCSLKGESSGKSNPHIESDVRVEKALLKHDRSPVTMSGISFAAHFSNGIQNNNSTSSIIVKDIKLKLGDAEFTAALGINDLTHPKTSAEITGTVYPLDFMEFFNIPGLAGSKGSVNVKLNLSTGYWPKDSIRLKDLAGLKPEAELHFNHFSPGKYENLFPFFNVDGDLALSENWHSKGITFEYRGQKIEFEGDMKKLPEWLAGKSPMAGFYGNVTFDRFIPSIFFDNSDSSEKAVRFPPDINADLNFRIGRMEYRKFSASDVEGVLHYRPGIITFTSFKMNTLEGTVSGDGLIAQNNGSQFLSKGSISVSGIDIKNTFSTFNNFSQDFIVAKNLSGKLTGRINLLFNSDSALIPVPSTAIADGKFTIAEGTLTNFDPVKKLSSFIALSELENIHFEKLENDFYIRNNVFYLPSMDVRSSAADLSVTGKHDFHNRYEYHVKMLLSQLLSRKRKKQNNITEFGVVQDDGLGRTSMLLRIDGNGDDVKVGYDLKAAVTGIKNNMKSERQNLKSILKDEYGWYRNDTTINSDVQKKKTFHISWDQEDTAIATPPENKKNKKGLFRK